MSSAIDQTETQLKAVAGDWRKAVPTRLRTSIDTFTEERVTGVTAADSEIKLFGVVTSPTKSGSGVAPLGTFKIQDFYYGADSPALEFSTWIDQLFEFAYLAARETDEVSANVLAAKIWSSIADAKRFLDKISPGHDEVVMALFTVAMKSRMEPVTRSVLELLSDALKIIHNKVCYKDDVLDDFEDLIERAGFSLSMSAQEIGKDGKGIS